MMAKTNKVSTTYKYIANDSILVNQKDEYLLTEHEYYLLHAFYVSYSMCGNQSQKKRSFVDYGWESNNTKQKELNNTLESVLKLNDNFVFYNEIDYNLRNSFLRLGLTKSGICNLNYERAALSKTPGANHYLQLFYRIRNGFAHGKYALRISEAGAKVVLMQDNDSNNVTARIVLKLDTLLEFIRAIDRNGLI